MSSRFTCIAVPLSRPSPMRIRNSIPTGGAHTPPGGRNAGRSSRNGSPNLRLELGHQLEPTPLRTVSRSLLPFRLRKRPATSIASPIPTSASGYGPPATATRLGKRAASPALTSLSSQTEPGSRQQAMRFTERRRRRARLSGACAECMREVTVTAALAHCANSVNGRATRRASQSPRECEARIRCRWVLHRCGFALLPPPSPSASLYAVGA
jgi:hypothetical protein